MRQELTREQHVANQELHHRRLRIEHVNSSVKRCRIVKDHIPTDLVVAQEASDVESSSRLDFLLLHNLRRRFIA